MLDRLWIPKPSKKILRAVLLNALLKHSEGNSIIIGGPTSWEWRPTLDPQHHGQLIGPPNAHQHINLSGIGIDDHHPRDHAITHQLGGIDEINVAGLLGLLGDLQNPIDHGHQAAGGGQGGQLDHGLACVALSLLDDDHPQYVLRNILTAQGDVFIRGLVDVQRLGVGAPGEVLTVVAGLPSWQPGGAPGPHAIGGAAHIADTYANINTKVTDAVLDSVALRDAAIGVHTAIAAAHHARYTDAEAQAVADTQIATHTAIAAAHHVKYTDGEAVSAVNAAGVTLAAGKNVQLGALSSDHNSSGTIDSQTAGENLVFGEICYVKADGKMWKADADAAATMPAVAMALATINANDAGLFLYFGKARDDSWSWTVGGILYADEGTGGTAGGMIQSHAGFGSGDQVQVLGVALSATMVLFTPSLELVEIA